MKTTKETRAEIRRRYERYGVVVCRELPDLLDDLDALEQERDRDGILADLAFTHTARSAALRRERDQLAEKLRVAVEALAYIKLQPMNAWPHSCASDCDCYRHVAEQALARIRSQVIR